MKSAKNLMELMSRKSFLDFLIAMNGHNDVKEWSEVGGVFRIIRKIMKVFNPIHLIDIGCGKRPTLATLLALNYGCGGHIITYAVDPQLTGEYSKNIKFLHQIPKRLEEFVRECSSEDTFESVLAISNHGHCKKHEIESLLKQYKKWIYISVPCCVDNRLNQNAIHFKDIHSFSPRNDIYIYADSETFKEVSKIKLEK